MTAPKRGNPLLKSNPVVYGSTEVEPFVFNGRIELTKEGKLIINKEQMKLVVRNNQPCTRTWDKQRSRYYYTTTAAYARVAREAKTAQKLAK